MHITILTAGSRGDVQPYLALASGLMAAGHQVRLAANSNFAPLAEAYDLDFAPIDVDSFAFVQKRETQAWLNSATLLQLFFNSLKVVNLTGEQLLKDAWQACQGTEAIIYHTFTLPTAYLMGQQLQVPCLPASLYPLPTRAHPCLPLNLRINLGGMFNLLSHKILEELNWLANRSGAKVFWSDQKKQIPWTDPYYQKKQTERLILCGYSEILVPLPPDLPDYAKVTGYWLLDAPPGWQPPQDVVDFLESGPPPVFVGFASMGDPLKAQETTKLVIEALEKVGQRGILVSGWSGLGTDFPLPDTVCAIESIPYAWLMSRVSVVVHHAGAGSTGYGLSAGVPNVVIPHFSDNHFWSQKVLALGVSPPPIPRKQLTADKLAEALKEALENNTMKQMAAIVGQKIKAENGVRQAVAEIEQFFHVKQVNQVLGGYCV
ncbi:MAG: glycosyltransferase [Candidatus Promineifilaceae bacterium]